MNTSKADLYSAALAPGTLGEHLGKLAQDPSDPGRPALVVQGGGLRGVYSLAALAVLEELGLRDAFSRVIGSSAGAINGAYFLAGQARESISIYTEDLSNKDFVNPWRFRPIVDIDFMIEMLRQRHPLKEREMLRAPATLYTVLTDAETAEPHVVSNRDPRYDIYETFRATAALPGLYNKKVSLAGRRYVDGGVAELVPLKLAFSQDPCLLSNRGGDDRPKEAVVLLTRGSKHRKSDRSLFFRWFVAALAHGQSAEVRAKLCGSESEAYNELMEELNHEWMQFPRRTWTLRPTDVGRLVNRTTNNRDQLRDCAELARSDMFDFLAQERIAPDASVAESESAPGALAL